MTLSSMTVELGTYARQGYLVEPTLLQLHETTALHTAVHAAAEHLLPAAARAYQRPATPARLDLDPPSPEPFEALARHPEIVDRARLLLDATPRLLSCIVRLHPPHGAVGVPWRQEAALYQPVPSKLVSAWVCLDDAIEETGCMVVLPRSHRDGLRTHRRRDGEWLADATPAAARTHGGHAVLIPSGGVIFLDGHLLHAVTPNRGGEGRAAIQLNYVPDNERPQLREV